jgi:hypothetical protein
VRALLALAGLAGAALMVVSTWATVIRIKVLTTGHLAGGLDTDLTGSDRHGVAFLVIGVFAAVMLLGALRGAWPAMAALAVAGILALAIAIAGDADHIHDTGTVGQLYEDATADAGSGFFLETAGGALALASGGGLLLLGAGGARRVRARREREAPDGQASVTPAAEPSRPERPVDDWFSA